MSVLLDSNVVSELRKGDRADSGVTRWFAALGEPIYLSVLTLGEIRRGIESIRLRDRRAAASLDGWLRRLAARHADSILEVDERVADAWGRLNVPDPVPVVDGLLAATALVHGLTLATRNVRNVEATGVDCVNPFSF